LYCFTVGSAFVLFSYCPISFAKVVVLFASVSSYELDGVDDDLVNVICFTD
jgi:hypothetical protein